MRLTPRAIVALGVALAGAMACSLITNVDDLGRGQADAAPTADSGDASPPLDAAQGDGSVPTCAPGNVADLVGYYNFDEGSGTVAHDCSGKKHDGTLLRVDGATWATGIKGGGLRVLSPNGCVDLGGVSDFVMTGAGLTVMAWANTANYPASTSNAIVGKSSDLNVSGWRLYAGFVQELGAGIARPGDAGALFVGKEPLPGGVWNHLAVVFAPGVNVTFFIDGTNVATKGWTTANVEDTVANVRIGCRGDNTGFYDGTIDEVRIYARALNTTEIAQLSAKP